MAFDERETKFESPFPGDMVEVQQLPSEIQITIGEDIQGEVQRQEAISNCGFNYLGAHFVQKFLGAPRNTAMLATTPLA